MEPKATRRLKMTFETEDGPVSYTHLDVYKRQMLFLEGIIYRIF